MTTLIEAAAACCACLRVHWTETKHPDGTTSGRWLCTQCGNDFVPGGPGRILAAAQAVFDIRARAQVGELERERGEMNTALRAELETITALRADLATAAKVTEQLAGELDQVREEGLTAKALLTGLLKEDAAELEQPLVITARAAVVVMKQASEEIDELERVIEEHKVITREYLGQIGDLAREADSLKARVRELELQVAGSVEGVPNGDLLGGSSDGGKA